ncbi:MAG TPA: hypothetical protein VMQ59_03430, partial [Acidimicrobiales bacterium]|nr:hypothetical protein [Acidimicrobiales bacterium]
MTLRTFPVDCVYPMSDPIDVYLDDALTKPAPLFNIKGQPIDVLHPDMTTTLAGGVIPAFQCDAEVLYLAPAISGEGVITL